MDESVRILHVDDDSAFADATSRLLERENDQFSVWTAESAATGLELLAEGDFDCIVSDYDIPETNGIAFLKAVREDHPELPFILFTGMGSEDVASDAITAGVTDYIQKAGTPEQYAVLANRISIVVDAYRSQQLLSERTRQLETLISNLPGLVYRCRNEFRWPMIAVEGDVEDLTGFTSAALRNGDVEWGDIIHPDDHDRVWDTVQSALAAGDSFEVTYRITTENGATNWVWERGREVTTGTDDESLIEGFVFDITARKEREHELERYETILEALGDPVYVVDKDGYYEYVNEAYVEQPIVNQRGITRDDLIGAHVSQISSESVIETMRAAIRQLLTTDDEWKTTVETTRDLPSGETTDIETHIVLLPPTDEGSFQGTAGVMRDITERTRRKRELERYETVLEALGDPVYVLDPAGHYTFVNDAFLEHAGYDREDILGEHVSKIVPDEDVERGNTIVRELLQSPDRRSATWELTRINAAGEPVPSENHIALLPLGEHGEFRGTAGVVRDVSERDERERELERQNERLEEFVRVVSHDLRNPLNVVKGHLELVRSECESGHLAPIDRGVDRMDELISNLLTFAREGTRVNDYETVALATIIEECWQTVETGEATITIESDRVIRADSSRLQQLFENLVRNAVEHGGQGVHVRVGDIEDGFYIADDGPGIPEEDRERVFHAGYTTAQDGSGFGLSIVKQVVDAHDWIVRVTDDPDGGARFEITGIDIVS